MRAPRGEPALEESLERYQRRLRERASESIHQLKYALEDKQFAKDDSEAGSDQSSEDRGSDDSGNAAWQELQNSHAVNQLKFLLEHQERMESEVSLSRMKMSFCKTPEVATRDLPALSDLVPIINDQSQYISHLEAEVKFCKEELSGMKGRLQVVVLENEELHQKLKFLTTEHMWREQTLLDASADTQNSCPLGGNDCSMHRPVTSSPARNKDQASVTAAVEEIEKWHVELEKLKLLYQEKVSILDAQIESLRKDLSESRKTCQDLEGKLKHQTSLVSAVNCSRVGGLCLKCAQHEAVLAQTHCNVHKQTIEMVKKERDDLADALVSLRQNMKEMQKRESNACEQVKQAVQMAEEASLEKTKALVLCEQLKSEIERQKNRLEKELTAQLNKRTHEKEALREEMKKEREDLVVMVTAMSENVAMLEAQVERITREKKSLVNQLEESQRQLESHEMEMSKKIEKLGLELNGNKQRLEQAQQDVTGAREECLKLTELLSKSEHQLHLTSQEVLKFLEEETSDIFTLILEGLEKESIQHSISNEAKARALQAQQREQELTQKMQQMEAQHEKTVNELDSLLTSQNAFIAKLKEECCLLARKLEQMSEKYRSEVNQLSQEKEYLHVRLEKMQKRNDELDQQCVQHGRMHERMKSRLQQLDKHCQATAQQLVELLNKQNQLFKEKQLLTEEVQFLRTQEKKWDADLKQDTDGIK
ncbi:serologically defined colon cancer antigen 8 isoform X3 [Columba livia]|uniref:serologically defined colon cancer antigen 8 isoform X3 n=1 Tax=Columba livia TaxID=8932 RepID=UPI0031BB1DB3